MAKRIILIGMILILLSIQVFGETYSFKTGYILERDTEGNIKVIRIKEEDGYHDWFVIGTEEPNKFIGFDNENTIVIIEELIDISIM